MMLLFLVLLLLLSALYYGEVGRKLCPDCTSAMVWVDLFFLLRMWHDSEEGRGFMVGI